MLQSILEQKVALVIHYVAENDIPQVTSHQLDIAHKMVGKVKCNGIVYSWYTCLGAKLFAWCAKNIFLSIDVLCMGSPAIITSQKMWTND